MEIAINVLSAALYQVFWCLLIKDFKIKNIFYILSPILCGIIIGLYYYFYEYVPLTLIPFSLILVILINLSFIDCKYYEISGHSYWFLLIPALITVPLAGPTFYENLLGFVMSFAFFWVIDKIIGIEKIGGADVKILMILAFTISVFDFFSLLGISFLLDMVLFMIKLPIDKIRGSTEKTRIPMIVAITTAWVLLCFFHVV